MRILTPVKDGLARHINFIVSDDYMAYRKYTDKTFKIEIIECCTTYKDKMFKDLCLS